MSKAISAERADCALVFQKEWSWKVSSELTVELNKGERDSGIESIQEDIPGRGNYVCTRLHVGMN